MLIQEKKNFNEPVLFLEENAQKGYITRLLGHSGRVCHPNFTITNWLCRFSKLNILIFRDGLTIHLLYITFCKNYVIPPREFPNKNIFEDKLA